ncbi:hypothetical protein pb186bvf_019448 [Paramecium bursaria]
MNILDIMRERVQDIQCIPSNTVSIKQIKYREKLRQIAETDIMSSLYAFRKLNSQDLSQFQDGSRFILRTIVPGFDPQFTDLTLSATSKVFIELYHFCGFQARAEALYNDLINNTKQQIFLSLIQHLLDLTKMAMQTALKRFLDLKLFCIGKEIKEPSAPPQITIKKYDYSSDASPARKRPFQLPKKVQRSESNVMNQQKEKNILQLDITKARVSKELPQVTESTTKGTDLTRESPQKSLKESKEYVEFKEPQSHRESFVQRESQTQREQTHRNLQKFDPYRLNLPSIHRREIPLNMLKALKSRNQSIDITIQTYLKQVQNSVQQ